MKEMILHSSKRRFAYQSQIEAEPIKAKNKCNEEVF